MPGAYCAFPEYTVSRTAKCQGIVIVVDIVRDKTTNKKFKMSTRTLKGCVMEY